MAKTDTKTGTFYCLERTHPAANGGTAGLVSLDRNFEAPITDGAPICPACEKGVSAYESDSLDTYPDAIQQLAERGI